MEQREEVRKYFKDLNLTYDDIRNKKDLTKLSDFISNNLKPINNKIKLRMSKIIKLEYDRKGLIWACLYINGSYFNKREAISFNENGFIGFAGWSDKYNVKPIIKGFKTWCDFIKDNKE